MASEHSTDLTNASGKFRDESRFEFGRNWQRFLRHLDQERIAKAEISLKQLLDCASLEGKTFLDVGSGSGLFSLVARKLGAKVTSFDYDPESVACASQLKRSFFPGDNDWHIERGSILDREFLRGLGTFDIVYSWGVLHHTGAMWSALENVSSLVTESGKLVLAIYNDQGHLSNCWRVVKLTYNRTPPPLRFAILWPAGGFLILGMTLKDILRMRWPRAFTNSYNLRGMSLWTDIVDWVGGYPFEVASPAQITEFYQNRGFYMDQLLSCGRKMGCNQYVITRVDAGSLDHP